MPQCDACICPGLIHFAVQQPLLVTQGRIVGEHAGDAWRLHVTVNVRGFQYDLTAADILQPDVPEGADTVHSAMRGRLTPATFWGWDPFRMVRRYITDSATFVSLRLHSQAQLKQ